MNIKIVVTNVPYETVVYLDKRIETSVYYEYWKTRKRINEEIMADGAIRKKFANAILKMFPNIEMSRNLVNVFMKQILNYRPFEWHREELKQISPELYELKGTWVISDEYIKLVEDNKDNFPFLVKRILDYGFNKQTWIKEFSKMFKREFRLSNHQFYLV